MSLTTLRLIDEITNIERKIVIRSVDTVDLTLGGAEVFQATSLGVTVDGSLAVSGIITTFGTATNIDLVLTGKGAGLVVAPSGYDMSAGPASAFSTKGYVDAQDVDFSGDSGTGTVNLNSEIFAIVGTANEIETFASGQTLTIGLPDDVIIAGDLTVSGTTTTVDTANLLIEDPLFVLSKNATGVPLIDSGLIIERGASANVGFLWDESADAFAFINTTEDGSTAGNVVITSYANFRGGWITGDDKLTLIDDAGDGSIEISVIAGTATNVDLLISPAGTGNVMVPSGYVPDDAYSLVTKTYVDAATPLGNFVATTDPTTSNDNTQGYSVGSIWVNTSNDEAFICTNASTGTANWLNLTFTSGEVEHDGGTFI